MNAGPDHGPAPIGALLRVFPAAHPVISLLFLIAALGIVRFSAYELWVVAPGAGEIDQRLGHVLDGIALLTIAVASLEPAQTIVEEEVQREAHMSAPTRVRRFLSRFMVVLVRGWSPKRWPRRRARIGRSTRRASKS